MVVIEPGWAGDAGSLPDLSQPVETVQAISCDLKRRHATLVGEGRTPG